jgi:hypothetical protein
MVDCAQHTERLEGTMNNTTTYRCSDCMTTTTAPTSDDLPLCKTCDGLLFDDERVVAPTLNTRRLKFKLIGTDYEPGDDRLYDVSYYGQHIGEIERTWLISPIEGGTPPAGFSFTHIDGRYGEGRTRAEAVLDAISREGR